MDRLLPNFLIIGAGKSGTTALHNYCESHPDVWMTDVKETNFFELEGQTINLDPAKDPEQLFNYPQSITNWTDYEAQFKGSEQVTARGETSPMYLYGRRAPGFIKDSIPSIKLIAMLRDPVDRLYSRWTHLLRDDNDPVAKLPFEEALSEDSLWLRRDDLVREGKYFSHLSRYFKLFNPEQIKVFLFDDLKADSGAVMRDLFEFIGVDPNFQPDLEREYNVSGRPKNRLKNMVVGTNSPVIRLAKAVAPGLIDKLKNSDKAQSMLNDARKSNMEKPEIDPAVYKSIYTKYYQDEVSKLEGLINRDLSAWKKYESY